MEVAGERDYGRRLPDDDEGERSHSEHRQKGENSPYRCTGFHCRISDISCTAERGPARDPCRHRNPFDIQDSPRDAACPVSVARYRHACHNGRTPTSGATTFVFAAGFRWGGPGGVSLSTAGGPVAFLWPGRGVGRN